VTPTIQIEKIVLSRSF